MIDVDCRRQTTFTILYLAPRPYCCKDLSSSRQPYHRDGEIMTVSRTGSSRSCNEAVKNSVLERRNMMGNARQQHISLWLQSWRIEHRPFCASSWLPRQATV